MIISINAKKAFDKIQHPFRVKILRELEVEENFLNLIKTTYKKPTANIILNGKNLEFVLLNTVLEVLGNAKKT